MYRLHFDLQLLDNGDETVRITVPKLFSSMSIDMSKSWEFLPDKLRTS